MKKNFKMSSTPGRLAALFAALIAIAVVALGTVNYLFLVDTFLHRTAQDNTRDTASMAKSIGSFVATAYNMTQELAMNPEVTSMEPARQQKLLVNRLQLYTFIDNMHIQNTDDGSQVARAEGQTGNRSQRWWFKRMIADNRPFVSKSFHTFGTGSQADYAVAAVFFPIMQDQRYVGIIVANLKLAELQRQVEWFSGSNRISYILDGEGTVLAHPDQVQATEMYNYKTATKSLIVRDEAGKPVMEDGNHKLEVSSIDVPAELRNIVSKALAGESGHAAYTDFTGDEVIASYAPIMLPGASDNWVVITAQKKDTVLAAVKKIFISAAVIILLLSGCLIAVIIWQMKKMGIAYVELQNNHRILEKANREISMQNCQLQETQACLEEEAASRLQAEQALLVRNKEYKAALGLLTHSEQEDGLLPVILQDALELLQAPNGYIALLDKGRSCFRISLGQGIFAPMTNECFPVGLGMCGQVYSGGKALYIEDYRNYPQRMEILQFEPLTSVIMAPLISRNEVTGLLVASWTDQVHNVNDEDIDLVQHYGNLVAISLENIVNRKKIRHMAYHDSLTGLPNLEALKLRLEGKLAKANCGETCGAVLFIDLDDLKMVNDTFGHSYGDGIIIRAGAALVAGAEADSFVARVGGDEFIVILPGANDKQTIVQIANSILEFLHMDLEIEGVPLLLSASIGIARYPRDGSTVSDILKNADNAMYAAKREGKNKWRFYENRMQAETYETVVLTNSLRNAVKRGELSLEYQPQVCLRSGAITGFEALLRWNSPELGRIAPDRFIPLAEHSGLILPIGVWVLQEACRFIRTLTTLDRGQCRVAVNVSPRQLADAGFVDAVKLAVMENGIKTHQLEIEVTEGVVVHSLEDSIRKLEQLKALNVTVALDDFGTGYSSLTHLQRLPVNVLKVDKSFIDSVPGDVQRSTLVESIIGMAHALNLQVLAEGVETREQYEWLVNSKCDFVQGYFVSRPLREEAAIAFLKSSRTDADPMI